MGSTTMAPAVYTTLPSTWGPVHLAATEFGVAGVELRGRVDSFVRDVRDRTGAEPQADGPAAPHAAHSMLAAARGAIEAALKGEATRPEAVPLDWRGVGDWDRRVLEGTRTVGWGQAIGYGRLAERIGMPGAARAVGAALGRNPFWILVPCHRVIAGDGSLGGYGGGYDALTLKRELLAREGTTIPVARLAS